VLVVQERHPHHLLAQVVQIPLSLTFLLQLSAVVEALQVAEQLVQVVPAAAAHI
jgi:hypothetical protein